MNFRKVVVLTGYQCNNDCLFCNVGHMDRTYNRPYREIASNIVQEYKNGSRAVEFLGGEFTIRKDAVDIVKKAENIGYGQISVETNGRAFASRKFTGNIARVGLNKVMFSIHGHNSQIHDKITRSKNSFIQTIRGLENIGKHPGIETYTNFVINKINFKHIKNYLKLISQFDIAAALFSFINPVANALTNQRIIVPRISKIAPYLKESFESDFGVEIKVQHIPSCLLTENKHSIVRAVDKKWSYMVSENKKANFAKEIRRFKTKPEICRKCALNSECDGIWKGYHDLYGDGELRAIK